MGKKYKQIKQLPLDTRVVINDDSWDTFVRDIVGDEKTFITRGKITVYGQYPNGEWGCCFMSAKFANEHGYEVISFEDFLKDYCEKIKYAYHAQTEEEAEWFCKDKTWVGCRAVSEKTYWNEYLSDTCYDIEYYGKLAYGNRTFYISIGYEIIEISEMPEYIEWKKSHERKPKISSEFNNLIFGITENGEFDIVDIIARESIDDPWKSRESDMVKTSKREDVKGKYAKLIAISLHGTSIELDENGEVVCEDGEE